MIDLVNHIEELVRIDAMLLHQTAQARAIAPIQILLQPERFVVRDLEKAGDVVTDADIDLLPKIEMMRIERVVEIEHPGLDRAEAAHGQRVRHVPLIFHAVEIRQPARPDMLAFGFRREQRHRRPAASDRFIFEDSLLPHLLARRPGCSPNHS